MLGVIIGEKTQRSLNCEKNEVDNAEQTGHVEGPVSPAERDIVRKFELLSANGVHVEAGGKENDGDGEQEDTGSREEETGAVDPGGVGS